MILGKRIGFSLVEILVALIMVSVIMAALAPVITKKLSSAGMTIGAGGTSEIEFQMDCSAFSEDCALCFDDKCTLCTKDCADNEFTSTPDCLCKLCNSEDGFKDCEQCTAKKCKKCLSGYGLVSNTICKKCEIGYYSDGTTECLASPVGAYVDLQGQSNYKICAVGTYQDKMAQSSCITCLSGTYQNEEGQSSCKTCEIDYMCTGGNNRTQCATNKGANAGSSSCSDCPSNCADCQIPNVCLKCNAGYYLYNGACYACSVGYSCDGSTTQTKCAAGTYNSSAGSSSCKTCPAGYSCSGGSNKTQCAAGKYAPVGSISCSSCSAGTYSAAGAENCSSCSDATINCSSCTSSTGVCTACVSPYKLVNGQCNRKSGPPTSQEDCDPFNAHYFQNTCITKGNVGDVDYGGAPIANIGIEILSASGASCATHVCCWQGTTSNSCTTFATSNYSGCNRTLCDWNAANVACSKYAINGTEAGSWSLPTLNEANAWASAFSNDTNAATATFSKYLGRNGVDICDHTSSNGSSICGTGSGLCKGAADSNGQNNCHPNNFWLSQKYSGTNYRECYTNKGKIECSYYSQNAAMSARCVLRSL